MNTNLIAIAMLNVVTEMNSELTPRVKQLLSQLASALQEHHSQILDVKRLAFKVVSPELHKAVSLIADRSEIEKELNAPEIINTPAKTLH